MMLMWVQAGEIMARRKRGNGWQVLVKWSGWPLERIDGWEAQGSLNKCEALPNFYDEHGSTGAVN